MEDDFDALDEDVVEEEFDDYEEDLEAELEVEDEEADILDDSSIVEDSETEPPEHDERSFKKIIKLYAEDINHRIIQVRQDSKRETSEIIQVPEMVEAVGIRASQIENGAPIFTDVSGLTDPISMARKEFLDRQNPLILERKIREFSTRIIVEHWKVREMKFPRNLHWRNKIVTDNEISKLAKMR